MIKTLIQGNIRNFLKFGTVGILNSGITTVVYSILVILKINFNVAYALGFLCGVINSYIMNGKFVFKSSYMNKTTVIKFFLAQGFVFGLSSCMLSLLVKGLLIDKILAQILTTGFTMLVNYAISKIWVFKIRHMY